ncbi:hypothetical protein EVAR_49828_1 [Eumeta japonica]|uniref:Uncharacterized protein n=1 Tax=Eumeta variegata TaxID=151549 RepID=A0A4C1XQP3_EUMVA|nr:hypothetical protein EVAR_49828_1 [Eumeta japonica]
MHEAAVARAIGTQNTSIYSPQETFRTRVSRRRVIDETSPYCSNIGCHFKSSPSDIQARYATDCGQMKSMRFRYGFPSRYSPLTDNRRNVHIRNTRGLIALFDTPLLHAF